MQKNYANGSEVPMGLGMALAQNLDAMNRFSQLSPQQKNRIIQLTHQIESKQEMAGFAQKIADGQLSL